MENGEKIHKDRVNGDFFIFRLFIAGSSPVSVRAIKNLHEVCEEYIKGRYELEIIDAYQQPILVRDEDVTAIPMLIKLSPGPKRRLIGDFSDREKVLRGLGINL